MKVEADCSNTLSILLAFGPNFFSSLVFDAYLGSCLFFDRYNL